MNLLQFFINLVLAILAYVIVANLLNYIGVTGLLNFLVSLIGGVAVFFANFARRMVA